MNEKKTAQQKIWEFDFVLHELALYADTHPTCQKAQELIAKYRILREESVAAYEKAFGKYAPTADQTPTGKTWQWIRGPWPWENNFTEE